MVTIQNYKTIKELRVAGLIPNSQSPPTRLADSIVPVININPKDYRVCDIVRGVSQLTTGTYTIYTTPADRDFYLTGFNISYEKNVTADVGSISLNTNVAKVAVSLFEFQTLSLTASRDIIIKDLVFPVKIDRNVTIDLTGSFTAGALVRSAHIYGYTVEPFENETGS